MNATKIAYQRFSKQRFPLPSEEQVEALEQQMDAPLPNTFRQYLLDYNGGYFAEPCILPPTEECPQDRLTVLYGLGAENLGDELGSAIDLFEENDPCQILPIGYTMMGNLLVAFIGEEEDGYILMKKASSDQYFLLAETIDDFFGLLAEPEEEE